MTSPPDQRNNTFGWLTLTETIVSSSSPDMPSVDHAARNTNREMLAGDEFSTRRPSNLVPP